MTPRTRWIAIAVAATVALAGGLTGVLLDDSPGNDASAPGPSVSVPGPSPEVTTTPSPGASATVPATPTPSPATSAPSTEATAAPAEGSPPSSAGGAPPAPADGAPPPVELCGRITQARFEELTGLQVTQVVDETQSQCDYVVDGSEQVFARLTARSPEDFTSWSAYVATQPTGPEVSQPDVGDGAYVVVVDSGDSVRYATAESAVGSVVYTWELALPGTDEEVRTTATQLLAAVTEVAG